MIGLREEKTQGHCISTVWGSLLFFFDTKHFEKLFLVKGDCSLHSSSQSIVVYSTL